MKRKRRVIFPAFVIAGVLLFAAHEPVLLAIGDYLAVRDTLQPADVIHVIAGEDDRTDYAIQLYKQGYGKRILFTGGWCKTHGYYHGQHGAARAGAQGVPAESILVDETAVGSTYDEIVRLQQLVAGSDGHIRSIITVSDAFHGRRAAWTDRFVLGDRVSVQFAPVPYEASSYQRRWWTDAASRAYVRDEYEKLVYYLARYRLGGPFPEWLVSLDRE